MSKIGSSLTRREAISAMSAVALAPAIAGASLPAFAQDAGRSEAPLGTPLTLVSRHLQWTDVEEGIDVAVEAGFPAVAWTVRPGAHIEPAVVERELPRVIELSHRAGLATPMIITQITDRSSPYAEAILATMAGLGIRRYRAAVPRYNLAEPIAPQIEAFARRAADLAVFNEQFGTTAMFHTHSRGHQIGGSGWDMWLAVRDLDPRYVGMNFDVGHVTAKGGDGLHEVIRAARSHIHAVSVKDFVWRRKPAPAADEYPWETYFVPPGEGMVDFPAIFSFLADSRFEGPLEMYYEYEVEVPGAEQPMDMLGTSVGQWELELPRSQFVALLRRDLNFYQRLMQKAGMAA